MGSPLLERVPPQSLEAEQATLGAMMVERDAIREVVDGVGLAAADFYSPQHQLLFDAIARLYFARKPVDAVTLQARLQDADQLEQVGGPSYLLDLQDASPTAAAVSNYAEIVKRKARLRQLIRLGGELQGKAQNGEADPGTICAQAMEGLFAIAEEREDEVEEFAAVALQVLKEVEDQRSSERRVLGIPTGIKELDALSSGWQTGYHVIAARPSAGKSAFMWQQCWTAASKGRRVLVFSLEMTAGALARRYLASATAISLDRIMGAYLRDEDFEAVVYALGVAADWRLGIASRADLTAIDIRRVARRVAGGRGGLDLVAVDYLQLVGSDVRGSRNEQITDANRHLKAMSQEIGAPVLVLSQLNRRCEEERRRPALHDLRDSGTTEQDADSVLFIHNPHWDPTWDPHGMRELILAKQRNGATAYFNVSWHGPFQRFAGLEADRGEEEKEG